MNETKHTPGPWVVREQGEACDYAILTPDKNWVLGLRHNGEPLKAQQIANLRLCAAAPELLEALKAAEYVLHDDPGCARTKALISAAIAKAEGRAE